MITKAILHFLDRIALTLKTTSRGGNAIMKKQVMAVLALLTLASSAFGQISLPGAKRKLPDVPDIIRKERVINILQVMPCDPVAALGSDGKPLMPAGITDTSFCLTGPSFDAKGAEISPVTSNLNFPACRFVGSVLCLDPGPNGDFASFLTDCPAGTTPVIQGAKLRKVEPRVPKCPDIYPGVDWTQTGNTGIRTFWALKYTPCNTTFTLDLEIGCVSNTFPRHVVQVRVNRFTFRVVVRPETLRWVVEALHCQPLGVCEIPCITDEGLFQVLLNQADDVEKFAQGTKLGSQSDLRSLNDALDRMESTIVKYALFTDAVWGIDNKTGALIPCDLFGGAVPGNKTIGTYGFGIVDTFEHPCACKLIADIVCLKADLIGTDP
jgi:hypothetical protein